MEFSYTLVGSGWAQARVAAGATSATFRASYLTDALADLLAAVTSMVGGAATATCRWTTEPRENRWVFRREADAVLVQVLRLADVEHREPDERGAVAFQTRLPLRELAEAVADGATQTLSALGEAGYREAWVEHPFPTARLQRLRALLDA